MKIEMKANTVTITSSTKKEAKRMVEFYYGMNAKQPERIVERVIVKDDGSGRSKYARKSKLYKKVCPKCGLKKKNLILHDKLKHQPGTAGPIGWHKTGVNPFKKREVRELLPAA